MLEPRPHWSETAKAVVSILLVALGAFLLSRFSAVLKPVILAVVIAFILTPLANYFQERLKLHRLLAILLAYLVLIAVLIALPLAIIQPLGSQLAEIKQDIAHFVSDSSPAGPPVPGGWGGDRRECSLPAVGRLDPAYS
jgi:predicted PurR-regulated permease PerM